MKFIAPIHVIDYTGAPGSVQSGFKKFYLKDGYFKLFDGTTISDVVLDRPLDNYTPLPGTISANDTVLTALEKLDYAISNINPQQSLQLVVNAGNAISNFGGTSTADIQSTNFVNNRTLYLNNDAFATIRIVDNLNAAHNLTIDLDTINIDGVSYNWSSIVSPPPSILSALPFSTDHLATTSNQYIIGDVVYYLGDVYRCIANNDSITPSNTSYWTNVGPGYPIVQQPIDWDSTSGNNQILNKPTIPTLTSQLTNDVPFLVQQSVLQYPTINDFPLVGVINTIYIALDTDLAYSWDGSVYTVITAPVTGITGGGTINTIPKFTPTGNVIGNSRFTDNGTTGFYGAGASGVYFISGGNVFLSLVRSQSRMDFTLGNPQSPLFQENIINSDNTLGTSLQTKGYLALRTGATANTEGLRLLSTGQLQLPQTPAAGATSDYVLLRDTSGNVKQIAYPAEFTSPLTTKGDIFVRSTVDTRLPIGSDTQILAADSAEPTGLKWINVPATGVTSIGLTVPSAFNVTPTTPITTSGTFAITGAGVASQYVRGDGTLATLPTSIGGGSSVSYYLNGSVNQGTIGGVTYYEMNRTPILGTGTDFQRNTNGYIASFLTDANDPALLSIPAGNWNFETYFQASSGGGSPTFYIELYKYNGTTFSLIASNSGTPKLINDGTTIEAYFSALAVPQTTLLATDRLAVRIYVNTSGRTITLHTENGHLCQVITTFSTGLAALNGLTAQVQYFNEGTSGTDFNIQSTTDTHTFNIPDASATARGALLSADWITFNNKQDTLVSNVNIKTVAGVSLIGPGNVPITTSFTTRQNANNTTNPNINYCGVALGQNIPITNTAWTIRRLTISAAGVPVVATTTVPVRWVDRETATYT
jgi:hypothetical protein